METEPETVATTIALTARSKLTVVSAQRKTTMKTNKEKDWYSPLPRITDKPREGLRPYHAWLINQRVYCEYCEGLEQGTAVIKDKNMHDVVVCSFHAMVPKIIVMSYDLKCYQLSEAFLSDHPEIDTPNNRDSLAQQIQDVIEEFIDMETLDNDAKEHS
jgi:hypothetical protein